MNGSPRIIEQNIRFQFVDDPPLDAQWVDDYMVVRKELHEVEPAEGGCILILLAPAQLQVVSLDVISQSCDFIISYGRWSHSEKALRIATTMVDDEPSPLPGAASE